MGKEVAGRTKEEGGEQGPREEGGEMAVALPSYTIEKHQKTHMGLFKTHDALISPSKHLHPYPYKP